ncbi:response regulator [Hymenobacter arizonensis]|uniref:Response regulator receiver domain-containing protein n=1 Tax=Hymenobacter arizonensis TaxID=1227077 RepID=A0A1I6AFE7_HYMAR|nr:response regulator [Hymenobacter arizonensis]SFQ67381.1 Response regulator receiver domain-containing protein [Hymenobacter arizonensis]
MPRLRCVLLVDDDPTTNYLHRKLLNKLGVVEHILTALNGVEAMALVNAQCHDDFRTCPDLILLDVNMPLMNGFEFLDAYHSLPTSQQCAKVVVMLTTSLHPRDVERAHHLPVSGFLTKPLTTDKFLDIIQANFAARVTEPI